MDFTYFNQIILILALSVVTIALFKRFNIPESLGYIFVGVVVGPTSTGYISDDFDISFLAEIGVVFLLFTLGLEFSLNTIKSMKKEVFGFGGMQVLLSIIGIFGFLIFTGNSSLESLVISGALALSSTAIVLKELTQRNELRSRQGQLAISVLLFQDIAAVLFLILIPAIASSHGVSIISSLSITLIKGVFFVLTMLAAGKWVLPKVFHEVAQARSEELFVLTALMTALMAAWVAHTLGLSMALGGFVAGMMMGESNYKHQIEADIRPFRDVLLGLFFVSIGLMLDMDILRQHWPMVMLATSALVVFKFFIVLILARTYGEAKNISMKTALFLCQGGEFCFAMIALASQYGQTGGDLASIVLAITILSMIIAPLLIRNSRIITGLFRQRKVNSVITEPEAEDEEIRIKTAHIQHHTLICGYGRVGQTISRFLAQEGKSFVVLDEDPMHVEEAGKVGDPVFFGDCRRIELLEAVGLARASQIVICIDRSEDALTTVKAIRDKILSVPILVRTKHFHETEELKKAGATVVIPEMLESSLLIVKHVMLMLGFDSELVRKRINHTREHRYEILNGYYPGLNDYQMNSEISEHRHAITVKENSVLLGSSLHSLEIEGCSIVEFRRSQQVLAPEPEIVLEVGDIVVLSGSSSAIAKAEKTFHK
ncbi:MAG: cation:proton antiporter [Candidatus Endonucleobacter bathymodioli]|uniref:Cation:proton antiporter n=1 Tax=Candidatus Endonucleibacter bathymodioli TaxID=539814 RepID=A0AA90SLG6_9GAMM|nr:cation:proton antiporter [Candidatus Endonucleobacter bathymodioli]